MSTINILILFFLVLSIFIIYSLKFTINEHFDNNSDNNSSNLNNLYFSLEQNPKISLIIDNYLQKYHKDISNNSIEFIKIFKWYWKKLFNIYVLKNNLNNISIESKQDYYIQHLETIIQNMPDPNVLKKIWNKENTNNCNNSFSSTQDKLSNNSCKLRESSTQDSSNHISNCNNLVSNTNQNSCDIDKGNFTLPQHCQHQSSISSSKIETGWNYLPDELHKAGIMSNKDIEAIKLKEKYQGCFNNINGYSTSSIADNMLELKINKSC